MRILAIRGRNLASLAGEFAVELERPPLAGAGLFAIIGPTGAGKSTLLDALCLALFDAVPRLENAGKVTVGHAGEDEAGRLHADDVRSLLRRGAVAGHAEVDFLGNDGRRYRARWEVRRARGRAGGRIQAQEMSLLDLDGGKLLGRTRSEVREAIVERLGLSFDQFRRAALLPQGDFAAFLKAAAGERAALLERITGTAIYSQLSVAAHERARTEREHLQALERELHSVRPLPADERATLEAERAAAGVASAEAEAAYRAAQALCDWHRRRMHLAATVEQAAAALADARQIAQAAAERRRLWQAVSAAQPLRLPVQAVERARAEQQRAAAALAEAESEWEAARQAAQQAAADAAAAATALQAALVRRAAAQPQLQQARGLDQRLAQLDERLAALAAERSGVERQQAERRTAQARLEAERLAQQRECQTLGEWLARHRYLQPLAEQWPRWEELLRRLAAARAGDATARASLERLTRERAEWRVRWQALEREQQQALAALQAAEAELDEARQALAGANGEALVQRRRHGQVRREALRQGRERWLRLQEQAAAGARLTAELEACADEEAGAGQALAAAAAALPQAEAALAEAETALRRAELAAASDVRRLRAGLRAGEPCPVCGAIDHPYAEAAPALVGLLQAQRERVTELRQRRDELAAARAHAAATLEQLQRRRAVLEQDRQRVEAELGAALSGWREAALEHGLPADPLAPGAGEALAQRLLAAEQALATLAVEEQARCQAELRLDAARGSRESARERLEAVHARVQELRLEEQRLQHAQALAEQRLAQAQGEAAHARQSLAPLLADWPEAVVGLDDAECLRRQCAARVTQWQAQRARALALEQALSALAAPLIEQTSALRHGAAQLARLQEETGRLEAERAKLADERRLLFAGRPCAEVEAELDGLESRTRARQQAAQAAEREAAARLAAAEQQRQHWQTEAERGATALAAAHAALERELAARGLELAALRPLLAHDEDWLEHERRALEALAAAVREAELRLAERQRLLAEHEAQRPGPGDAAEAEQTRAAAETALSQARQVLAGLEARLHLDDERRRQAGELAERLEAQRRHAHLWEALRELIGSHDGSKFRVFAQSLTLDTLLAQANRHLAELARRYRLQRVPGNDALELQVVDTEMGDEVRSVHSLSGGESFLVSLALALALASLSSRQVAVGTLLIDEGFGTLDPDTLDTALAALDALQAQGRQVGVISHVKEMVERIGVQVRVEALGGGRSRVRVLGPGGTDSGAALSRLER